MKVWYTKNGKDTDVVVSTRIRLARNIANVPFPAKWSDEQARSVTNEIKSAAEKTSCNFEYFNIDNTPDLNKLSLVEDHLMSREMLSGKNRSLLLDKDGKIAIMIGEEDHIRLQVIESGLDIEGAYECADKLDDELGENLEYAYHEKFGFLTWCPTNTGTAIRASVMLHLPAIRAAGRINSLAGQVGKLGLTIRGLYGEGSESQGDLYQLSNQITLGISEKQAIEKLAGITNQIIKTERDLRAQLLKNNESELSDRVYRAFGTLKYARKISSAECEKLLSHVKLGADLGIITEADPHKIIELMIISGPAHISLSENKNLTANERDIKRADLIRSRL